jgi:hypothetical protein
LGDICQAKNAPKDRKIRPNGKISPNLVTLFASHSGFDEKINEKLPCLLRAKGDKEEMEKNKQFNYL